MVIELRGKVDGKEIAFDQISHEVWNATIPMELCGFYVVELEAFDEAGNRAYVTKFLLTFDPEALTIKLEPCNYQVGLIGPEFDAEIYVSRYVAYLDREGGEESELDNGIWRGEACQAQS